MTVRDGFAIFVLTHGRPKFLAQHTARALHADGYTGPWWILLDDADETRAEYEERWPGRVLIFHKDDAHADMGDNGGPTGTIIYARNAVDRIAAELGLTWTLQLDDDYNWFGHRFVDGAALRGCITRRFDEVIEIYLDFLEDTGALTVAFAQGGDYMGGAMAGFQTTRVRRKAMNSFFCRVGRPVGWVGRFNEDVNAYVAKGATGELFLTAADFALDQVSSQQASGGMTDGYKQIGTYAKSFYSVMFAPSAVKITTLGRLYDRIHHTVLWNSAVPKILPEAHRKPPARAAGGSP